MHAVHLFIYTNTNFVTVNLAEKHPNQANKTTNNNNGEI